MDPEIITNPHELPAITKWSLHTLGGVPVLRIEAIGQRCYQVNQVVSDQDFEYRLSKAEPGAEHAFRGVITKCLISMNDGAIAQNLEILIHYHSKIANGEYRPKTIAKSDESRPVMKILIAKVQADRRRQPEPQQTPTRRRFDLHDGT